jgi:2,4-dichlorophenol 6-monooxygenase
MIAGEEGGPWVEEALALAEANGLPIDAIRVGHLSGDYLDPQCRWITVRDFGPRGAVLIRPDRFVAWRHLEGSVNPRAELASALEQILCRKVLS